VPEVRDTSDVWLAVGGHGVARFVLRQSLRPQTLEAMHSLHEQGVALAIRSGDQPAAVRAVAERLQISDWAARQSAQDKRQALTQLQGQGHRVGMVGDGLNDGAALAQADVSISFAQATPLAQQQADVLLLGDSLQALPRARTHATHSLRIVRQNLCFAAAYNLSCIPLALVGWMPPWLAGLGMAASSLVVVLNALRVAAPHRGQDLQEAAGLPRSPSSPA
jgi:Cu2+-exporting ATPase